MSYTDAVSRDARRVVSIQALLTVAMALAFGLYGGVPWAAAALYGGIVTMGLTAWLAWRMRRVASLTAIYSGAVARYALAAAAIGVGVGLLRLAAVPLLCAFAVTQFGFLVLLRRP